MTSCDKWPRNGTNITAGCRWYDQFLIYAMTCNKSVSTSFEARNILDVMHVTHKVQFCRLVEKASKGDHLFDNHTTECAPPPLRNQLVKPMSERILKVSTFLKDIQYNQFFG